jgi:hypothetical protein
MHYLDPVTYSKKILALMEDEMPTVEETIPVKDKMTIKERISNLLPEEKQKLKEYMEALIEIVLGDTHGRSNWKLAIHKENANR